MRKKRSPKEVIESTPYSEVEHYFYKLLGKEMEDITERATEDSVMHHRIPHKIKKYSGIHTHPTALALKPIRGSLKERVLGIFSQNHQEIQDKSEYMQLGYGALPSPRDMIAFLKNQRERVTVIAVREPETGKVRGYTVVRKTKKIPKTYKNRDIKEYSTGYNAFEPMYGLSDEMYGSFGRLAKKYNLQCKFLPAKGYEINRTKTQFMRKRKLEQMISIFVAASGIGMGLFFLGNGITGNAILGTSTKSTSLLSIGLIIVGLAAGFFWLKRILVIKHLKH